MATTSWSSDTINDSETGTLRPQSDANFISMQNLQSSSENRTPIEGDNRTSLLRQISQSLREMHTQSQEKPMERLKSRLFDLSTQTLVLAFGLLAIQSTLEARIANTLTRAANKSAVASNQIALVSLCQSAPANTTTHCASVNQHGSSIIEEIAESLFNVNGYSYTSFTLIFMDIASTVVCLVAFYLVYLSTYAMHKSAPS